MIRRHNVRCFEYDLTLIDLDQLPIITQCTAVERYSLACGRKMPSRPPGPVECDIRG